MASLLSSMPPSTDCSADRSCGGCRSNAPPGPPRPRRPAGPGAAAAPDDRQQEPYAASPPSPVYRTRVRPARATAARRPGERQPAFRVPSRTPGGDARGRRTRKSNRPVHTPGDGLGTDPARARRAQGAICGRTGDSSVLSGVRAGQRACSRMWTTFRSRHACGPFLGVSGDRPPAAHWVSPGAAGVTFSAAGSIGRATRSELQRTWIPTHAPGAGRRDDRTRRCVAGRGHERGGSAACAPAPFGGRTAVSRRRPRSPARW